MGITGAPSNREGSNDRPATENHDSSATVGRRVEHRRTLTLSFDASDGPHGTYQVDAWADTGSVFTESGQVLSTFAAPETSLMVAVDELTRSRSGDPDPVVDAKTQTTGEQLGEQIYASLLGTDDAPTAAGKLYRSLLEHAPVRLCLDFTNTPELLRIPWEFMCHNHVFLVTTPTTLLVREVHPIECDGPLFPEETPLIEGPIRILGMVSNPEDDDLLLLDVDHEKQLVEQALAKSGDRVEMVWLDPCTKKNLRKTLRRDGPFHVLHYVGHSSYSDTEGGLLYLTDKRGGARPVSDAKFAELVRDETDVKLVVLNSCTSSRASAVDPFSGVAGSLIGYGCNAVVAMQFKISDIAAIAFAEALYESLVVGQQPVDQAVAAGRLATVGVNDVDFANPCVFLDGDRHLFDFTEVRRATLEENEKQLGPDHPDTLRARSRVADSLRRNGWIAQAVAIEESVLSSCERILGPEHSDTIDARANLAISRGLLRDIHEQISIYEGLVAEYERDSPGEEITEQYREDLDALYRQAGLVE